MLKKLEQLYNQKLERYQIMSNWCENASIAEQLQQEANIVQVINDCNNVLNQVTQYRDVSRENVLYGFKG